MCNLAFVSLATDRVISSYFSVFHFKKRNYKETKCMWFLVSSSSFLSNPKSLFFLLPEQKENRSILLNPCCSWSGHEEFAWKFMNGPFILEQHPPGCKGILPDFLLRLACRSQPCSCRWKKKITCSEIFFTWAVRMIAFRSSSLRTFKPGNGNRNSV